jgi:hypothetical protein
MRYTLLALAIALAVGGCGGSRGSFAPPIHAATYGAPGHLAAGNAELNVGVTTGISYESGGLIGFVPSLAWAPTDWLAFEGGAELYMDTGRLGFAGIRFTPTTYERIDHGVAIDFALGGGAGVGGKICDNKDNDWYEDDGIPPTLDEGPCPSDVEWDGRSFKERFAIGGYFELGLGYRVTRWLTYFWRPRFQAAWSEGVPETFWASFVFGPHIRIMPGFAIHFSAGPLLYYNGLVDNRYSPFIIGEFGLSFGPGS